MLSLSLGTMIAQVLILLFLGVGIVSFFFFVKMLFKLYRYLDKRLDNGTK